MVKKLFSILLLFYTNIILANSPLLLLSFDNYPPYSYKDNQVLTGIYPDVIKEAFIRMNYPITVDVDIPWKRALLMARNGEAGLMGIVKNDERVEYLDFSEPFYEEVLSLFVHKDNYFEYTNIQDLKDKVVGINRGFTYGQEFEKFKQQGLYRVQDAPKESNNFRKLNAQRIDVMISDKLTGTRYLSDTIKILDKPFNEVKIYIGLPKAWQQQQLLQDFNKTIKEMQMDGTLNAIANKYLDALD